MEFAPTGSQLSFEVTFDSPSLHVAMSVYDVTGASPSLVQGPTAMTIVVGNTYQGKFHPTINGKSYVIFKAVYTDNSFTTLSPDYSQGSESIIVESLSSGGSGATLVNPVIGYVDDNNEVIGLVNC